jgi:PhzF family phenazine biosynthesis protein
MLQQRRFKQVDVFTSMPFKGNPLAVVLDAEGLTDLQMQAIARWTNLSETTFVLPATEPQADYRVRIFSLDKEFPFAGHPTLGTAHALLEAGMQTKSADRVVQQCGIGLVALEKHADGSLAFQAPAANLLPFDQALRPLLTAALGPVVFDAGRPPIMVDMGIKWLIVRVASADACLAVRADGAALDRLTRACAVDGVAIYGPHDSSGAADYEVRALCSEQNMLVEDPVTGSANACIARVLQAQALAAGLESGTAYRVRQGTALQRDGRLSINYLEGQPWVGGHSVTLIDGYLRA